MTWNDHFLTLFDRCVTKYEAGNHEFETYFHEDDLALLGAIGYRPREFFDFVEDFCDDENGPSASTALLIAGVRRDYFNVVMNGETREPSVNSENIPTFGHECEGIAYLPRIMAKARAKLSGELDPDLMFGCGGDRKFLREHGDIPPADFLRHVWASEGEDSAVASWIKSR